MREIFNLTVHRDYGSVPVSTKQTRTRKLEVQNSAFLIVN